MLEPPCVHSPGRQCISGRIPQHVWSWTGNGRPAALPAGSIMRPMPTRPKGWLRSLMKYVVATSAPHRVRYQQARHHEVSRVKGQVAFEQIRVVAIVSGRGEPLLSAHCCNHPAARVG